MGLLLSCQDLAKSYHHRELFTGITLGLYDDERIGLIGPNGAGKSTFLKVLAGVEHEDSGSITRRRDLKLGYVQQEDKFPADSTPRSVLLETLADTHLDEHEADTRASILLSKIGFEQPDALTTTLSGGWRKRLAIARELAKSPNLLLLDEPTNHLDLEGIYWLEKLLTNPREAAGQEDKFACLVVSHDRYFLDNMTTRIVEINRAYPEGFYSVQGSYSDFLERKEEYMAGRAQAQQTLQGQVKKEIAWLRRGPKARRTKNKSRIVDAHQKIADLSDIKSRNSANTAAVKIDFTATERKTNKLLALHNISKTLGDKELFKSIDFVLTPGQRCGVLGPNGSGKTTLLKILNGDLAPDTGTIKRANGLRVVFFDQARQQVKRDQMLRTALSPDSDTVIYQDEPMHITSWAKRFLFTAEQLDLPVSALSGGEQARILIANLMLVAADVLILDEPTNDLDIPSLEVLEESLEDFPGAIILVTHDRYMLDRLSTELLALDGEGGAAIFNDFTQWENAQEARKQAAKKQAETERTKNNPAPAAKSSAKKKLSYMEQKEWDTIEDRVTKADEFLEACKKEMDSAMAGDPKIFTAACQKLHDAEQAVHTLYARWQELESKRNG